MIRIYTMYSQLVVPFLSMCIAVVSSQGSSFQVTSVNGRPVSGSASSSSINNFGSSSSSNLGSGSSGDTGFAITSVNGRPVNGGNQGGLINSNKMRMEVQLIHFENPKSLMFDGRFCDTASKCDPRFTVDLDTVQPFAMWPGVKPLSTFQNIYETTNEDVFDIGKIVVRDVCANVRTANLRVQVQDIDDVTKPDLIDEYDCIFNINQIGRDAFDAQWSQPMLCKSLRHQTPPFVTLTIRHREYSLPGDSFSGC